MWMTDEMWKFFHTQLIETEDCYAPMKQIRNRKQKGKYPWNKKTLEKINLKHKLYKKVIAKLGLTNRKAYEDIWHKYNMVWNKWKVKLSNITFKLDLARRKKRNSKQYGNTSTGYRRQERELATKQLS